MRIRSFVASVLSFGVIALPSLAAANPITAGVSVGTTESKLDGMSGADSSDTLGLFGRLGFNKRVSGQIELTRIKTDAGSGVDIRMATAALVIDLAQSGHLIPTLAAGLGIDSASSQYGSSTDAHHFEGGLGLEYRADGGLTIGADVRIGGRSIDSQQAIAYPATGGALYYTPSTLQEGEYRSARLFLGVRF
jgi:hypothetical protein